MFDVANEFEFWGRQAVEHAELAHQMLEVEPLRSQALQMRNELGAMYDAQNLGAFLPLLQRSIDFKRAALAQQRSGTWIGWAFPSMVEHMIDEESFALARMQGQPIAPTDLLRFWLHERAGETAVGAHLIDPSALPAVLHLTKTSLRFRALENAPPSPATALATETLAAQANAELLATTPNSPPSIISIPLRNHIAREGARCVQTLQALRGRR